MGLKRIVYPNMKILLSFTHTLKLFQTGMIFFQLLNTKADILKNVGNQTVDSSHWLWK